MVGATVDRVQRWFTPGEGAVIGFIAAAEVLVDTATHEIVETSYGVHQILRRHPDLDRELLKGVGRTPQTGSNVLLGFHHRDVGRLHRRDDAVAVVIDHPVGQRHCSVGHCSQYGPAEAVVGRRFIDESIPTVVDENATGEPQRKG